MLFVPTYILLFIVGLVFLIKGGDWFVDGATAMAQKFKIPDLLIGATVVSIGTTLPEVMVSTNSALTGHGEIAYGNALGSIICNTALIAAITIAVKPGKVSPKTLKLPVIFFFVSFGLYAIVAYSTGYFSRFVGITMLLIFIVYTFLTVKHMQNGEIPEEDTPDDDEPKETTLGKDIFLLVLGAVLIAVGADLLVENGTIIAQMLGVPEAVIGLTVIALGTSLPELVTAITSLAKGHGALSLGNVIGANLFNLVLVTGVAATASPFNIPNNGTIAGINSSLIVDIPVAFGVMALLCVPALFRKQLSRVQGIVLLLIYFGFIAFQFV